LSKSVLVVRVEPIFGIGSPMQSLTQWFAGLSLGDPAMWLALAAGLTVVLAFLFLGRRSRRSRGPVVLPHALVGSGDWEGPVPSARHDERRRAIRRGGLPTPILILDPKTGRRAKAVEAYVLDRSTGGLRLALEKPVNAGSTLLAKPGNAPEGFDWVKIVIRNCREVGDYFEVGCQFETELDLSRLLMFG
jgi:PilZ domain